MEIIEGIFSFISGIFDANNDGVVNLEDLTDYFDVNNDGEYDMVDKSLIQMKLGKYDDALEESFGGTGNNFIKKVIWKGKDLIP